MSLIAMIQESLESYEQSLLKMVASAEMGFGKISDCSYSEKRRRGFSMQNTVLL